MIELIVDAATDAGDRVTRSRGAPARGQLPSISVFVDSEDVDPASIETAPRMLTRNLVMAVECWIEADDIDALDDGFDDMALQIEAALDQDDSLGGTAFSCVLSSTLIRGFVEGAKPLGCVRLEYNVVYETSLRTLVRDGALSDFNEAEVRTEVDRDMADADQAVDSLQDVHE